MRRGKDFLTDKPGLLRWSNWPRFERRWPRRNRIYGILYSERFEVKAAVKAGELVQAGAIGRVIQTVNIAPHQIVQAGGTGRRCGARPDWFWEPALYGGILCDIGSHQADQFLYYTGSTEAEVVASQVSNVNHTDHPKFQDFGDMMLRGDRGLATSGWIGSRRRGWGRGGMGGCLFWGPRGISSCGNMWISPRRKGGDHLFIVDQKQVRYMDCSNVSLPFGPQFISDIVNRTHTAQDQAQALLTAEIVIKAQAKATKVKLKA